MSTNKMDIVDIIIGERESQEERLRFRCALCTESRSKVGPGDCTGETQQRPGGQRRTRVNQVLTSGHAGCTFTPDQMRSGGNAGRHEVQQTPMDRARKRGIRRRFALQKADGPRATGGVVLTVRRGATPFRGWRPAASWGKCRSFAATRHRSWECLLPSPPERSGTP
jgi:hypothetical protein